MNRRHVLLALAGTLGTGNSAWSGDPVRPTKVQTAPEALSIRFCSESEPISAFRIVGHGWYPNLTVDLIRMGERGVDTRRPTTADTLAKHLADRADVIDQRFPKSWSIVNRGSDPNVEIVSFADCALITIEDYEPFWLCAASGVATTTMWEAVGMSFEEWTFRALCGSWLNAFPMHVDPVYLSGGDCAVSLAVVHESDIGPALDLAMRDVQETLGGCGFGAPEFCFATYHGSGMDSCGLALAEECIKRLPHAVSWLHAVDWDEGISQPFVSVVVRPG